MGGGGDFYAPFWFDAKNHVFEKKDLRVAVEERIVANPGRARLFPLLRDGFLLWWNERRRWTNRPFRQSDWIKGSLKIDDLHSIIKIDNVLSARDSRHADHFIYPYFSPEPLLREEGARLGLWVISRAIPDLALNDVRILDVIRGQTFSIDRNPLQGNEERVFREKYNDLLVQWRELRREYE